jgi:hypothetical protein
MGIGIIKKKSHSSDGKSSSLWVGSFKPQPVKNRPVFDLTEKFKKLP